MKKLGISGIVSSGLLATICSAAVAAPVSFQQAVADYTAGKYSQANAEFESYKQVYPTNAMVHYYLALCKQAMGHLEGAKTEYLWVTQNGDARLKGMAQAGFDQLSKVRPSGSGGGAMTASTPAASTSTQLVASAKVKKIIEFYADW